MNDKAIFLPITSVRICSGETLQALAKSVLRRSGLKMEETKVGRFFLSPFSTSCLTCPRATTAGKGLSHFAASLQFPVVVIVPWILEKARGYWACRQSTHSTPAEIHLQSYPPSKSFIPWRVNNKDLEESIQIRSLRYLPGRQLGYQKQHVRQSGKHQPSHFSHRKQRRKKLNGCSWSSLCDHYPQYPLM